MMMKRMAISAGSFIISRVYCGLILYSQFENVRERSLTEPLYCLFPSMEYLVRAGWLQDSQRFVMLHEKLLLSFVIWQDCLTRLFVSILYSRTPVRIPKRLRFFRAWTGGTVAVV